MRLFASQFNAAVLSAEARKLWDWLVENADRRSSSKTAEAISRDMGLPSDGNCRELRRLMVELDDADAPVVSETAGEAVGFHIAETGEELDRCGCRLEGQGSVIRARGTSKRRAARLFQLPLDYGETGMDEIARRRGDLIRTPTSCTTHGA